MGTGSLNYANKHGIYWTTTTYASSLYTYSFNFDSTSVYSSDHGNRWFGLTVQQQNTKLTELSTRFLQVDTKV